METLTLKQFRPTLQMLSEELNLLNVRHQLFATVPEREYKGVRPFSRYMTLQKDYLYLVSRENAESFPVNHFDYICTEWLPGQMNHIFCPDISGEQLMALLLDVFRWYQDQETKMDHLVFAECNLTDLCNLAEKSFGNPVCIHDDWFMVIAVSSGMDRIMKLDYSRSRRRGFLPAQLVEDFKFDTEYLKTYSHVGAALWNGLEPYGTGRSIYVNLIDNGIYKGRLLVLEDSVHFRTRDFLMAECIAQRATMILKHKEPGDNWQYHSMDDIFMETLRGEKQDIADISLMLELMQWEKDDQYACALIQSQERDSAEILGHVVHGDLCQMIPNSYVMFLQQQQCVVVNMTKSRVTQRELRYLISPACRDYGLYAGVSSPVRGVRQLSQAFRQADIALKQAFYLHNQYWVMPFSVCALDVMLRNIQIGISPMNMVAPELLALKEMDERRGTQFFATLKGYLLNERDIPKAAQELIVHRSTLIYRIKKIQTMFSLDLDDPEQRLYLLISLKLMEQEEMKQKESLVLMDV